MKLNPPASSSDLEVARQIARRLHQQRRRDDQPGWAPDELPTRARLTPPPLPARPSPEPPPEPSRAGHADARPAPFGAPAPLRPEPPAPRLPTLRPEPPPEPSFEPEPEPTFAAPEPKRFERPSWSEPEPEPEPEIEAAPSPESLEDLAPPPSSRPFEVEVDEEPEPMAPEPEPELPGIDTAEPPLSPEEMVGEDEGSPLDSLTDPGDSPFGDELLDAPPASEEPATPSWDDIAEACRGFAQATGAILVDPDGQVFAATGDWPAPGPTAIAGKLVAMMAKTLKDAPTRSISAPLMGMHLTAWRVPREEGLVTAAFIGPAPVRADARPAIDGEIHKGPGA
jgi:hypothetical protein